MARVADVFRRNAHHLPTMMLTKTDAKFGNVTPAFNNSYDVFVNLRDASGTGLIEFINKHGFLERSNLSNPGEYLRLFCSEAFLPGTQLETQEYVGQRQGIVTPVASLRRFPDVSLTFYAQRDYYTQDVFNAWIEYISPIRIDNGAYGASTETRRRARNSFRRNLYPDTYKCSIEVTAFDNEIFKHGERLEEQQIYLLDPQITNSITYYLEGAFPTNIIASPLAYGNAELIKTTITFKYENYFIDRTSRQPNGYLNMSDVGRDIRGIPFRRPAEQAPQPGFEQERAAVVEDTSDDNESGSSSGFKLPRVRSTSLNVGLGLHHWSGSSDIRLKENIVKVGRSPSGLNIYEWNYIWGSPRYSGVMAQEIINIIPEAVVTMPNGYLGVNYAKIDVDMLAK